MTLYKRKHSPEAYPSFSEKFSASTSAPRPHLLKSLIENLRSNSKLSKATFNTYLNQIKNPSSDLMTSIKYKKRKTQAIQPSLKMNLKTEAFQHRSVFTEQKRKSLQFHQIMLHRNPCLQKHPLLLGKKDFHIRIKIQ